MMESTDTPSASSSSSSSSSSSNADMFGGPSSSSSVLTPPRSGATAGAAAKTLLTDAAKLRQEAAEMEVALREEARARGLPEEMINKLVPLRSANVDAKASREAKKAAEEEEKQKAKDNKMQAGDVRSKLGYLNAGDAVRVTSELDRIKSKGAISLWNSKVWPVKPEYSVNSYQLKAKANIDPKQLKLDDVGYNYQAVFGTALVFATVFGLSSSFIGGELGFILGYCSALFPITLVGVGSIAPALIGDILNKVKFATNKTEKDKYVAQCAGKFLVGYVVGLPVSRFSTGSPNQVEFFQLRPSGKSEAESKQMFARSKYTQNDIARASAMSIAGNVAECMLHQEASGTNPGDVSTLYELMNSVEPAMQPSSIEDHIRWSALTAYEILNEHKEELNKLVKAFEMGLPLEECIAVMEGQGDLV